MRVTSAQLCDELRKQLRTIQTDSRLVAEGDVFVALPPPFPGNAARPQATSAWRWKRGPGPSWLPSAPWNA